MKLYKTALNVCRFTGLRAVARPFLGGSGSILMLHHVRSMPIRGFSPNHHLSVDPGFLEQLLSALASRYDFVSMDGAADRLEKQGGSGEVQKPFLVVTLDDGYRDNIENAVPVFRKFKVPYLIYLAPGLIDGKHTLWWEDLERAIANLSGFYLDLPSGRESFASATIPEKRKAYAELSEYLFFRVSEKEQREIATVVSETAGLDPKAHVKSQIATWRELKALAADPLCTFGAHTLSHCVLSKLDADEARFEIEKSRDIIKAETGQPVRHFAYPYGFERAAGKREFEMVRNAGFKTGVTTRKGVVYAEHAGHMSALPRISLNGHFQSVHYVDTLLSGLPTWINNRFKRLNVE